MGAGPLVGIRRDPLNWLVRFNPLAVGRSFNVCPSIRFRADAIHEIALRRDWLVASN